MRLRRVVVHADSLGLVQKTIEILLLLCGGESFSSDDASDSELDSVMPTKGKYTIIPVQYQDFVALRCRVVVKISLLMVLPILHWTAFCRRREIHHQLHPVPL